MSGSLNNIYNNVSFALHLHTNAMAKLQEQASTGSRINRVSDDPAAAYRVLGFNTNEKSLENYINNLSEVSSILELSSTVLDNITSGLAETQIRLTQISSGIYDEAARKRTAEGIDDILEQIVSLANTQHMDQYLFGGTDTGSAPYTVLRTSGKITSVTYQGSFENRDIEVALGMESSAFHIGDNIFRSNDRSVPVFIGDTGAKAGTGTSNVQGYTWLTITDESPTEYRLSINDGTDYVTVLKGKGSEVQELDFEGKTPTDGSFTLTFDSQTTSAIGPSADSDTIKAALVALPNLDADDIVSVTGTFATDFTITFADTMGDVPELVVPAHDLVDGGGAIAITPSTPTEGIGDTNLAVTDSAGRVLYVNTTGIISTGVDLVSVPGTYDIFNVLIIVRDVLENEKGLSDAQAREMLNNLPSSVEETSKLMVQAQVSIGSKIGFLDDLKHSLKYQQYDTEDEATRLEEADIAQVAIDLARREVLYQMSLTVAARLMSMSLLDFI